MWESAGSLKLLSRKFDNAKSSLNQEQFRGPEKERQLARLLTPLLKRRPPLDSVRRRGNCSSGEEKQYEPVTKCSKLFSLSNMCNNLLRPAMENMISTILVYVSLVLTLSLSTDYIFKLPPTYFSNKRNIFNVYFVKMGWGWTLLLVGLMVYLTSSVRCGGNSRHILYNMARLIFSTFWWYFSTTIFEYTRKNVGFCSGSLSFSSNLCVKKSWSELDISGHSFLLFFCILVILEESKAFSGWDLLPTKLLSLKEKLSCDDDTRHQAEASLKMFSSRSTLVYCSVISVMCLFLLWNIMFVATLLYFHDTLQKLLGIMFATVGWSITYRFIFN